MHRYSDLNVETSRPLELLTSLAAGGISAAASFFGESSSSSSSRGSLSDSEEEERLKVGDRLGLSVEMD